MMRIVGTRLFFGLGFGSLITISFLSYYYVQQMSVSVDDIWLQTGFLLQ